jgi:hypothetical protein
MENKTTKTKIDEKNMAIHRKGVQQLMQAVKSKAKPDVDDSPSDKKKLKKGMFTDFGADKFGAALGL